MSEAMEAVKLTDNVYWVGAVDWGVRDFHGYQTYRGTTYNAYLVMADQPTLIDTVKHPFASQMMARIRSVIDPAKIEIIISNHSEPDHSGALGYAIERIRPSKVLASKMGQRALKAYYGLEVEAVANGSEIDLGGATIMFMETRMLHWPDSMVSYLKEQKLLFSQDGFGMHLASAQRFADEIPRWVLQEEAAKYFANILLPFAPRVTNLLKTINDSGLEIDIIAPDHGPIYRTAQDITWILEAWGRWALQEPTLKAVITYDTMWHSTHHMAEAIAEGINAAGAEPVLMPLGSCHRSDVATQILTAGALVVGSPTMNNNLFPTVADTLTYLKGLRPANLVGATFGSYGWSGEAPKIAAGILEEMKVRLVADPLRVLYRPGPEELMACRTMGQAVANALKEEAKP